MRDAAGQASDAFHLLSLAQLGFEPQPFGHVVPSRNEPGQFSGLIVYWRNGSFRVINRAVFLAVGEVPGPDPPFENRGPDSAVIIAIVPARFEKTRIAPDDFAARISRDALERGIAVVDVPFGIGDENFFGRLLDRGDERGALRLGVAYVRPSRDASPVPRPRLRSRTPTNCFGSAQPESRDRRSS